MRKVREEVMEPAGGRGNAVAIGIISLVLLGGTAAMIYSIAPDVFREALKFGPRSASAAPPAVAVQPAPVPDFSQLVQKMERETAEQATAQTMPGKRRMGKVTEVEQPESEVLRGIKKWTGLNGWNSGSKKGKDQKSSQVAKK
jgi:hypothetical protein